METGMTTHPPIPDGLRDGPVYLDYNATTPVDPRVLDAMLPYLATLVGADPDDVVFVGSGSEAAPHVAVAAPSALADAGRLDRTLVDDARRRLEIAPDQGQA